MTAAEKYMYQVLVTITLFVLGGGIVFYHYVEKFSWVNAYYFCVVTLTTVGYGDIVPHTPAGKLFTTVYILVGIGIFGAFINAFIKKRATKMQGRATAHLNKHKQ
jgi:voltage-gated potassium channel